MNRRKIIAKYVPEAGTEENHFPIWGNEVFNDGSTAILKVTNMYAECEHLTLTYDEVVNCFPDYSDAEHTSRTSYLCLDVSTKKISHYHDIDTYRIVSPDTDPQDYS